MACYVILSLSVDDDVETDLNSVLVRHAFFDE